MQSQQERPPSDVLYPEFTDDARLIDELSPKSRFELAREIVKHEDGLVNSRVTWLQVFQGLLFTAFFAGLGLLKDKQLFETYPRGKNHFVIALAILALLGMFSSLAAYFSVRSATKQLGKVEEWWSQFSFRDQFPPLTGDHGIRIPFTKRTMLGADILLVFFVVWLAFLTLFLSSGTP